MNNERRRAEETGSRDRLLVCSKPKESTIYQNDGLLAALRQTTQAGQELVACPEYPRSVNAARSSGFFRCAKEHSSKLTSSKRFRLHFPFRPAVPDLAGCGSAAHPVEQRGDESALIAPL